MLLAIESLRRFPEYVELTRASVYMCPNDDGFWGYSGCRLGGGCVCNTDSPAEKNNDHPETAQTRSLIHAESVDPAASGGGTTFQFPWLKRIQESGNLAFHHGIGRAGTQTLLPFRAWSWQ